MTKMMERALELASLGLPVIPLWWVEHDGRCACRDPNCRSAGKHPIPALVRNGIKHASLDESLIKVWWTSAPQANIGVATGAISNVFVVDVDPRNGGDVTLEELESTYGPLPPTVQVETGGGGMHYYYRLNGLAGKRLPKTLGKGIDLQGDGRYVVGPGSKTKAMYDWFDCDPLHDGVLPSDPPPFIEAMAEDGGGPVSLDVGAGGGHGKWGGSVLPDAELRDIRQALAALSLTTAPDAYETWLRVGMSLHSTNCAATFGLWCEWSATSEGKFNLDVCRRKWLSFDADKGGGVTLGTLYAMAKDAGWVRQVEVREVSVSSKPQAVSTAVPHPEQCITIPGILGEFVKWGNTRAFAKQPRLMVSAAIALGATMMAQRYSWSSARTSLLLVNVVGSGRGKDGPRQAIKTALAAAGLDGREMGEDFKSGSALFNAVNHCPTGISLIDEYGMFLDSINSRNSSPHKKELQSQLMRIATSYNSILKGAEYADRKLNKRNDINHPCSNFMGSTTKETLIPALTGTDVLSGFLNRHLIIFGNEKPVRETFPEDVAFPAEVAEWMRALSSLTVCDDLIKGGLQGEMGNNPVLLRDEQGCRALIDAFAKECVERLEALDEERGGMGAIWARAVEQAKKVAMVVSGSLWEPNCGHPPIVTLQAVEWAIAWVRWATMQLQDLAAGEIADSAHERVLNQVIAYIRERGAEGAAVRELNSAVRSFRSLESFKQEALLKGLPNHGILGPVTLKADGRGRPKVRYIDEQFVAEEGSTAA